MAVHDSHVHLAMAPTREKAPWNRARLPVLGLAVLAAALFAVSFFLPWWQFWLYAPQYPGGLRLIISLTGMSGDVHEIDLLNHYIGMSHLADAAPMERSLAGYGVAAIGIVVIVAMTFAGKRLNKVVAVPAIAFPIIFLADSFYWLYRFGHHLNPKAPLHIAAFTPQMFGNGKIGQFETFAQPGVGFWVAAIGVVCVVVAALLRSRVCAGCSHATSCGGVCPGSFARPPRGEKA